MAIDVLIIDDESAMGDVFRFNLKPFGCMAFHAADGWHGLETYRTIYPESVIGDWRSQALKPRAMDWIATPVKDFAARDHAVSRARAAEYELAQLTPKADQLFCTMRDTTPAGFQKTANAFTREFIQS